MFDTAFHQTMPPRAYLYAVPYEWFTKHEVRRYGFHGTSHRYVSQQAVKQLGLDPEDHASSPPTSGTGARSRPSGTATAWTRPWDSRRWTAW